MKRSNQPHGKRPCACACSQPFSFLLDLRSRLTNADGTPRSVLLNALVMHAGMSGIATQHVPRAQPQPLALSAPVEIYQRLLSELGPEARYVLLNGIANQLRYPNNHTHYFLRVMLHLFVETSDERVQEQITRARTTPVPSCAGTPKRLVTGLSWCVPVKQASWSNDLSCTARIRGAFSSLSSS